MRLLRYSVCCVIWVDRVSKTGSKKKAISNERGAGEKVRGTRDGGTRFHFAATPFCISNWKVADLYYLYTFKAF